MKSSIAGEGQGQRTVLYIVRLLTYINHCCVLPFHGSNSIYLTSALYDNVIWRARQC